MIRLLADRRSAAAFAPGHITGLFAIHDAAAEAAKRGSRGAGVCLALGARSHVEAEPADSFALAIRLNGEPSDAPVTRHAVEHVLKAAVRDGKIGLNRDMPKGRRARVAVAVDTALDLPASQGFGMSAAGSLSAALATARAVGVGRSVAIEAAHEAEVTNRTGLGDVAGAITGGFEIRTAPGIPPWGATSRFLGYGEVVCAVVGPPIHTADVLRNAAKRAAVNAAGDKLVDELLRAPSLELFLDLSRRFAEEAELLTPEVRRAFDAVLAIPDARIAQSMLGNSVFAVGPTRRIEAALAPLGETFVCPVDADGARLLVIER